MRRVFFVIVLILFLPIIAVGQNLQFHAPTLTAEGAPGDLIVMDGEIINGSQQDLHVRVTRVQNEVPEGWATSLCSGALCYPPSTSSYTIPDETFGVPALAPGDTAHFHLNFITSLEPGTASVPISIENLADENEKIERTFTVTTVASAVGPRNQTGIQSFRLFRNYPNPFSVSRELATTISFEIGGVRPVSTQIRVFDILGRQVALLVAETRTPGNYTITWNGRGQTGRALPAGLYFYEVQAGSFQQTQRMMLVQ